MTLSSIITATARRLAIAASATPMPSSGEKNPAIVGDGAAVAVGARVGEALGPAVAVEGPGVADGASLGTAGLDTRTSPPSATATTARTAMVITCQARNPRAQAAQ